MSNKPNAYAYLLSLVTYYSVRCNPAVPLPERELIRRIRSAAGKRAGALVRGIGDDCAVLRPPRGHELLVTTDFSLEGVHFRRDWHPAKSVGHRCLARGLSDIAAMGGQPLAAFLSLAAPGDVPQRWVDAFIKGLLQLADESGVTLAGGDTARSPGGVVADIVVLGSVPNGEALVRSGARAGDAIYVTGRLGGSAAAVAALQVGRKLRPQSHAAHFYPTPRIDIGRVLRGVASAAIDLSDGLSTDLAHLCEESGVGAVIRAASIPVARGATLEQALHGGEDYELLFTSRQRMPKRLAGVATTRIGEIVAQRGMWMEDERGRRPLPARGWEHFRRSPQ